MPAGRRRWAVSGSGRSKLDGWQQGFVLPAGANGIVRLHYAPQARFEAGLGLGGLLAVLGLICAGLPDGCVPVANPNPQCWNARPPSARGCWPGSVLAGPAFVLTGVLGAVVVGSRRWLCERSCRGCRWRCRPAEAAVGVCVAGARRGLAPGSGSPSARRLRLGSGAVRDGDLCGGGRARPAPRLRTSRTTGPAAAAAPPQEPRSRGSEHRRRHRGEPRRRPRSGPGRPGSSSILR